LARQHWARGWGRSLRSTTALRRECGPGYTRRNGLSIALHTCHEEFLEALINLGKSADSADDVGQTPLLTVTSLHALHFENVSHVPLSLYIG